MENKKSLIFRLALLVSLSILPACGNQTVQTTAAITHYSVLNTNYENALPMVAQLALGTFKLDESGDPLTAEQARSLLTLWKGYYSLTSNGNISARELEGLIAQIEKAYSQKQLQTIAAMKLTMEDMAKFAQDKNFNLVGSGMGRNENLTAEQQATREALRTLRSQTSQGGVAPGSGGFPGGGGPPPGGMLPEGGDPGMGFAPPNQATPGAVETAIAGRIVRGSGVSPALLQALIDYLKNEVQ